MSVCVLCAGCLPPAAMISPRAPVAGGRKAPRHEIAWGGSAADANEGGLARSRIERSFDLARLRKRHPTDHTCDPIMSAGNGEQHIVFRRGVRRFNRHDAMNPNRFELGHQVVRLERTQQRLERGITRIRRHLHPGRLMIGAEGPEVLMCIDDDVKAA